MISGPGQAETSVYRFGEFTLGTCRGRLARSGEEIPLRPKSVALLTFLLKNPGRLLSKSELLEAVWRDQVVSEGALAQCLLEIRNALCDGDHTILRNVPRRGYVFEAVVSREGKVTAGDTATRRARWRFTVSITALWVVLAGVLVWFLAGLGSSDPAVRALLIVVVLGFPVALVFGWLYHIGPDGIRRKPSLPDDEAAAAVGLRRSDYLILAGFALVGTVIVYSAAHEVLQAPSEQVSGENIGDFDDQSVPILKNSVAVLPFTNLSANPDDKFFSLGVAEEILNQLGDFKELNVIGRTSSFALEGQQRSAPGIAALLGAEFLVQGSVRRDRNHVRVSTQLLDAQGVQVWSATFDRELKDVFSIQSEIADSVATTVVPRIVTQASTGAQPNIDAYEEFLRGRALLYRRQLPEALVHLERAIELDPDYAEAHADLAAAVLIGPASAADLQRAQSAIDRALSLNPGSLRALEVRGILLGKQDPPDYIAVEAVLRKVLARDPDRAEALNWLGEALTALGRDDEAEATYQRGVRIDPLHPALVVNWAEVLLEQGKEAHAKDLLWRLIESGQQSPYAYVTLRKLYWATGQFVKMNRLAKREVLEGAATDYGSLMFNYLLLGDAETAQYWARRTEQDFPDHWWAGFWGVGPARMQGRYREAVKQFERGVTSRGGTVQDLGTYFVLAYGELLALAGDFEKAVKILEPVNLEIQLYRWRPVPGSALIPLAFAWSQLETEYIEAGKAFLSKMQQHKSVKQDRYAQALIAMLRGQEDRALDDLEAAIAAGWRRYYTQHHDPRWDPVRDHPRFQAMMAAVKADVDAMRAEVKAMDAEEDFVRKVDAMLAAKQLANQGSGGLSHR